MREGLPMVFFLDGKGHWDIMKERLGDSNVPDTRSIDEAEESLAKLEVVVEGEGGVEERGLWQFLQAILDALRTDSLSGMF